MSKKTTWGELRTLNADKLVKKMVAIGKGTRIIFSVHSDYSDWVLVPLDEFMDFQFIKDENRKLKTKLKTITDIASM